jgi:hypothetical protein
MGLILSTTAAVCLLLMTITFFIQIQYDLVMYTGMICGLMFLWVLINWFLVTKLDPELSLESARLVFPSGIILSLLLSFLFSVYLKDLIPGDTGKQHYVLPFVGLGISVYLLVRAFDVKWLRTEDEIAFLEDLENR